MTPPARRDPHRTPRSGPVRRPGGRAGPSRPTGAPDTARAVAWQLLRDVDEADAYANLRLPQLLDEAGLDVRDRAFATELGYGTLRAQGTLDILIDRHARGGLDAGVRDALRLGAY